MTARHASMALTPTVAKNEPDDGSDVSLHEQTQLNDGSGGSRLVCVLCGNHVTTTSARTSVAGSHRHVFCNPSGYVYEIGCFTVAPGCMPMGLPSLEFTWFPGHAWQVGVCSGCGEQLGWRFSTARDAFFGLILDRLREEDDATG